jgi:flagellar hook assembly protein FlgD
MTTIRYDLPRDAIVEICIYDAQGRLVRVLEDALLPAGAHAVVWNGRDDKGAVVGPGVYFCRMKAGEFTKTRKMSLAR